MNAQVIKVIIALLDDSEAQAERVEGAEEDKVAMPESIPLFQHRFYCK